MMNRLILLDYIAISKTAHKTSNLEGKYQVCSENMYRPSFPRTVFPRP